MKRDKGMSCTLCNRWPKNNRRNRTRMKMLLPTAIPLLMLTTLLATGSCRQKDKSSEKVEKGPVSSQDIGIGYADIEHQKQELQRFANIIQAETATEEPDRLLRQMVEHVSLQYIQEYLQELSRNASVKDKPNVSILLERINEMRNADDAHASQLTEKAIADGNFEKLEVALFGLRTETRQAKAADGLASLGKPESVRLLTMRLLQSASAYTGGSESRFYREQLRRSLVKALGSCTGLDFSGYEPASDTETLAIVKRCQDWLEKNEPKEN